MILMQRLRVEGFIVLDFVERYPEAIAALGRWMAEGRIKPHISGRYALADTPKALNDMAARKVTGKVVIQPQR